MQSSFTAQNFSVWFDLYSTDLTVMDINATYNQDDCFSWYDSDSSCSTEVSEVAAKNKYNASASSTYTTTNSKTGTFVGRNYYDKGTAVVDTVNVSQKWEILVRFSSDRRTHKQHDLRGSDQGGLCLR